MECFTALTPQYCFSTLALRALKLQLSKRSVIVYAFMVYNMHSTPTYSTVSSHSGGDISNNVFDKCRIIVSLHGHVPFVRPLKQRVNGGGRRLFCQIHQFFQPNDFRYAIRIGF
jgi:hypothetical protein